MEVREILLKLAGLEQNDIDTAKQRKTFFLRLANLPNVETVLGELNIPEFKTNIEAFRYVLAKHPDGLHVTDLIKELSVLGITVKVNNVSGVLRSYDAKEKYFKALGGNKFKLRED